MRSTLELQPLCSRLLSRSFALPFRPQLRCFNSTPHIIEGDSIASSRPALSPSSTPPPPIGRADPSVRELLPILASQPGHYITIHIHARPYLVTRGDTIRLPFKMPGVLPGDVLRLNRASVLGSRDLTLKGAPYIDEALFECRAVVLGTESEPMRFKVKKKQRTRRTTTVKSKHRYTVLRIQDLAVTATEL